MLLNSKWQVTSSWLAEASFGHDVELLGCTTYAHWKRLVVAV